MGFGTDPNLGRELLSDIKVCEYIVHELSWESFPQTSDWRGNDNFSVTMWEVCQTTMAAHVFEQQQEF